MDYEYYGSGAETAGLFAALAVFGLFMFIFAVAAYVVSAIFLMKLLKNAGHKTPASAWVPVWNTVSLMQIGGIKQPWIWTLIFIVGSFISSLIPYIGFIISLGILVAAIILNIYLAKGVQAGVGIESTGGIVLAVLLPIIWLIWIALASDKRTYDRDAAIREGSQMPMNWFGESDLYEPFGVTAPAYAGAYQQSTGYAQPQGYQPSAAPSTSGYQPPSYTVPEPPKPTAEPNAWTNPTQPPTASFSAPSVASEQAENGNAPEVPPVPPVPPRFSTPLPPRSREEIEDGDENRTI